MPTSAAPNHPGRPEDLIGRLNSAHTLYEAKLKALRDMKNQIIGNRTKKQLFLELGAVPSVVAILSSAAAAGERGGGDREFQEAVLIQSAAAIGSFSCGLDAGVKAVSDAGAFPVLLSLISHPNDKVVDASARSLKMIYQSKLAPKYEFLQEKKLEFLLSLLNSPNENVTSLGASIITHSCQTFEEQLALSGAGVIKKLVSLLGGSINQKDASLESLASMVKENPEVASKFIGPGNCRALGAVIELVNDKYPRTRLLASMCLISIRNTSTSYLQDLGIKKTLVRVLLELLDDSGQVGDEAPFALSKLMAEKEDMQKIAFDENVIEKLCTHLNADSFHTKRLQGVLLALSDLCSKLECCRDRVIDLQVLNTLTEALAHDIAEVRAAACILLKNISRSIKNSSAGQFMNESTAVPLVQLLCDSSTSVQIAALGAISNLVVDFMANKSVFVECGGLKPLIQLTKSMESSIRIKALWALKNLAFHVSNRCKEEILSELTLATLTSLIGDPEASVQAQALALTRNLVDGNLSSVDYVLGDDCMLLNSIGWKLLRNTSTVEVQIQGMYVFSNLASGNELHKEAVMNQLLRNVGEDDSDTLLVNSLQSTDCCLRTATLWAIVNLTFPGCPNTSRRVNQLWSAGIVPQVKNMVNDPFLDVKLRAKMALTQLTMYGDAST